MKKSFKVRTKSYRRISILVVMGLVIVGIALYKGNYWIFFGLFVPLVLWMDYWMSRIVVRENGDVWLRRGFTGVSRWHGISELIYRPKARKGRQIVLRHTKGCVVIDPDDKKSFIAYMRNANTMMKYIEE